jgi:hypothetical protein
LVSTGMEVTVDEGVGGEEVMPLFGRFEALHLPLSSSRRPMRVFGLVIQISALSVLNAGKQLTLSDAIAPQLVGHDNPRHILQTLQIPPEEALRSVGIAPGLNENVRLRPSATCLLAVADGRRHSHRLSCASAAPSHRRHQRGVQTGAVRHLPHTEPKDVVQSNSVPYDLRWGTDDDSAGRVAASCCQSRLPPSMRRDLVTMTRPSEVRPRTQTPV